MNLYDYAGVIHLHSSLSYDGHAPMEQILVDCAKNQIDFLMLTDHDHLQAREDGWEGWQKNTLVIVGEEISPRYNHYLAFNIREPITCSDDPEGKNPQKYIDAVNDQGGFGIIAHPDHEGTAMFHVKHYPWNNWSVSGYAAMSVWDFMTDWQKSLKSYFIAFLSYLFPSLFLKGPSRATLDRWDILNQRSKTVGIGELDNHASVIKVLRFRFIAFPFERAFKFIRTHVLLDESFSGNAESDIQQIFRFLKHGRCYFSLDYFRRATGFRFFAETDEGIFSMGDHVSLTPSSRLSVSCPFRALIRIFLNGREIANSLDSSFSFPVTEPGVYRVEAFLRSFGKYRPWIFSNPIFFSAT